MFSLEQNTRRYYFISNAFFLIIKDKLKLTSVTTKLRLVQNKTI